MIKVGLGLGLGLVTSKKCYLFQSLSMYEQNTCKTHEKRQGRENRIFKILPSNQIITACCIKLRVQEMTMNEKLTMIGLTSNVM